MNSPRDLVVRLCGSWPFRIALALLAVAGISAWVRWRASDPARASEPFRVGFQASPPYQYLQANGRFVANNRKSALSQEDDVYFGSLDN
jgi:hypothetical protein